MDFSIRRSLAHQPHHREFEEVEQAIMFIRTGLYLPGPDQSDIPDGPRLTERSSPLPDTGGLAENIDLTESVSLPDEDGADAANEMTMKQRRLQRNGEDKSRLLEPVLVRALVSIAENQEDAFQRVCLETLAELCTFKDCFRRFSATHHTFRHVCLNRRPRYRCFNRRGCVPGVIASH
jgi:hypothetical protein